jgi:hypothetical protein
MVFGGWTVALLLALAGDGRADPSAEDKAAAETLFQDALKLIKLNNYPEACPKLEVSNKLDPAVGTLFNLGDCYEHTGRTASAWSSFSEARRFAERTGDKRVKDATEREKSLEPRLARLVLQAADKPEGLVIRRDKKAVDAGTLGSAVPVDPGKHTIEVEAPGREPWSTTVDVPDQPGNVTVTLPPLAALRSSGPSASASAAPSGDPGSPPPDGMSGRKIAGIAVAGVGVAGLIAGGVFGGLTLAKASESKKDGHCVDGTPVRCDPAGLGIRKEGETLANVSNVAFAVGGAALIAGVIVYLTAPAAPGKPGSGRTIRVVPSTGALNGLWITGSY